MNESFITKTFQELIRKAREGDTKAVNLLYEIIKLCEPSHKDPADWWKNEDLDDGESWKVT